MSMDSCVNFQNITVEVKDAICSLRDCLRVLIPKAQI